MVKVLIFYQNYFNFQRTHPYIHIYCTHPHTHTHFKYLRFRSTSVEPFCLHTFVQFCSTLHIPLLNKRFTLNVVFAFAFKNKTRLIAVLGSRFSHCRTVNLHNFVIFAQNRMPAYKYKYFYS